MNQRVNGFLDIRAKAPESNEISSNPENSYNNVDVHEFWDSLSDNQKEELLIIKHSSIIENISRALNEFNLIAGSNGKLKEQETLKQTFMFNRTNRPPLVLTIITFDHLARLEEHVADRNYFQSGVIMLIEQTETNSETWKSKSVNNYPSIDEQELLEYVGNLELFDRYRAMFKIKNSKLDTIFKTFSEVYSNFCHGNKIIVSEEQYSKVYLANKHSDNMINEFITNEKLNGKHESEYLVKPKKMLKSALLMIENNILASYEKHVQSQTQTQTQSAGNGSYDNSNPQMPQQMYYQQPQSFHFHPMQGYGAYHHHGFGPSLMNTLQQKPINMFSPFEFIESGPIAGSFGFRPTKQLFEIWPGVFFGALVFELTGNEIEEEAYLQESKPVTQGARRFSDEQRSNTEVFAGRTAPTKRNLTYQGGSYPQRNYPQPSNDPLQLLLGISPFMNLGQQQQQQPSQQLSRPLGGTQTGQTLTVPLLETVIKLPGLSKPTMPLNPDFEMQSKGLYKPQMGFSGAHRSNGSYPSLDGFYNDEYKQEEFDNATATSNGSLKEIDRDSQPDSYQTNRIQQPGGGQKKKLRLKQGENNDFHANTSNYSDWGQLASGSTSEKQSGLADTKEPLKIPSKDKIQ